MCSNTHKNIICEKGNYNQIIKIDTLLKWNMSVLHLRILLYVNYSKSYSQQPQIRNMHVRSSSQAES